MRHFQFLILAALLFLVFSGCEQEKGIAGGDSSGSEYEAEYLSQDEVELLRKDGHGSFGSIVTADRASGTISVIDTDSDVVEATIDLPDGPNPAEPMYVVWTPFSGRVFVGDRANNRVVVFNDRDYSLEGTVPTGSGVFHMWADARESQLWVNNDIDNTITVIDPRSLTVLATIAIPADLVAMGGKPHDVILDPIGRRAYVTVLGLSGANDYLLQYSTRNFRELRRAPVGKDPHLSLTFRNPYLYIPCQNTNEVIILNRFNLRHVKTLPVSGAHGAGMALFANRFYTTNLPGGGADGLVAIDTRSNEVINTTDTPYAVPHNIALTPDARRLYITHSGGSSDKVSVFQVGRGGQLTPAGDITVGFNPFGLSFAR